MGNSSKDCIKKSSSAEDKFSKLVIMSLLETSVFPKSSRGGLYGKQMSSRCAFNSILLRKGLRESVVIRVRNSPGCSCFGWEIIFINWLGLQSPVPEELWQCGDESAQ